MKRLLLHLLMSVCFVLTSGSAQIIHLPEAITPAMENISRLETEITVDRAVYTPRESMRVTFTIRNPTTMPLEVPNPFVKLRAGFDFMRRDSALPFPSEEGFAYTTDHPRSSFLPRDTTPNLIVQPGESIERSVSSYESTRESSFTIGGAPYTPGDYRILYSYDTRSFASFQVVNPVLEQLQSGRMRLPVGEKERWVNAFVLVLGGRRLIMKSDGYSDPAARIRLKPETLSSDLQRLAPYERIAEVNGPVADLAIVDGGNYQTVIRWRDSSGRFVEHAISIDQPKQQ